MSAINIIDVIMDYKNKKISLQKLFNEIDSGKYDLGYVDKNGNTPLMIACYHATDRVALKIIKTGKYFPEVINKNGDTALILSCALIRRETAIALIESGKAIPEHINKNGYTALIEACLHNMPDVALKLIETGKSVPDAITKYGNTALLYSCWDNMKTVALALIETGKSIPEHIDENGNTALILSCKNNVEEIALKLIETGKSLPLHKNNVGKSALFFARNYQYEMADVIYLLEELEKKNEKEENLEKQFNINADGFDSVTQETVKIHDFLEESTDNICIKINNSYFLTSKTIIKLQLQDKSNIKYGCKRAGTESIYVLDSNILNTEYLSMSAVLSLQILVDVNVIKSSIIDSSSNLFYLKQTTKKFPSIISKAFIDGGSGVSADHCQPGKETFVYNVMIGTPIENVDNLIPNKSITNKPKIDKPKSFWHNWIYGVETDKSENNIDSNISNEIENKMNNENKLNNQNKINNEIKIQYKTNAFSFPVTETTTIEEIKTTLLNKLVFENIITSLNQNVKFIYKGKIYQDGSIVLSTLENPPFGITLQAMISQKTGGRKTKKNKKKNYRKTKKNNRKNKK